MPALNTNYSYEKMEELYKKGMTQEQIAKEIGCGKSTVYYRMKKHSMVTRDRSAKEYRKFDYDKACKLYLEGKSTRFIGNMFGVSKTHIRGILIRNGIKLRESMFGSAGANSPKYKGGLNINKRV
ncbi:helix-turn-helix domain-containing protein [Nitrosomonas sp. Nm58]|uniref:helix-turn-helix domain-containing protein n=1 Tax=Nitrosomonas sp. Nm58 TaxID=200126 RepID=UPI00089C4DC6|nr:helix-turn-helix domain-containing protein [Nitrosomonas sp. Nm58]SDY37645.1 Helix-turn-helix domain of resolvase [Nitrosomonas sp. Nm58]